MNESDKPVNLRLKRREERRIRSGHLWVFSNEIDTHATPLKGLKPGQAVTVQAHNGTLLGHGYANPQSLIAVRILSRARTALPMEDLIERRIATCVSLRERLYKEPYYRLVYGEADLLPGLVVDRFGDVLVAQIATAGMEVQKDAIIASLRKALQPTGILWQNTAAVRKLEGLEEYREVAWGDVPDTVVVPEEGVNFTAALKAGQKTGWYFDQRDNRLAMTRFAPGARVLDVCSYIGGWGIHAARAGALSVLCLDSSASALEQATHNAQRNELSIQTMKADAFEGLRKLRDDGEKFDLVILDPPAFIKRRKDRDDGRQAYRRLNDLALKVLSPQGILISCSCSQFITADELGSLVQSCASRTGRYARLLTTGYQGADHPVHPAIPETRYLKALTFHVSAD